MALAVCMVFGSAAALRKAYSMKVQTLLRVQKALQKLQLIMSIRSLKMARHKLQSMMELEVK